MTINQCFVLFSLLFFSYLHFGFIMWINLEDVFISHNGQRTHSSQKGCIWVGGMKLERKKIIKTIYRVLETRNALSLARWSWWTRKKLMMESPHYYYRERAYSFQQWLMIWLLWEKYRFIKIYKILLWMKNWIYSVITTLPLSASLKEEREAFQMLFGAAWWYTSSSSNEIRFLKRPQSSN